jgi:hypothetical protein
MRPTLKLVRDYFATLKRFQSHGVKHEQAVRSAFQALLADAGKKHKWTLIPELEARINGKRVVPDGTFRDHYNLPRGYWEAKDTNDNLNVEIQKKIEKGYPLNNMIFWTPDRAVLYQDKARVLDVDIDASDSGPAELCGVLILDPCTGTGNFVVNLLRRAAKRGRSHLKKMYREQLFANEVMLMQLSKRVSEFIDAYTTPSSNMLTYHKCVV